MMKREAPTSPVAETGPRPPSISPVSMSTAPLLTPTAASSETSPALSPPPLLPAEDDDRSGRSLRSQSSLKNRMKHFFRSVGSDPVTPSWSTRPEQNRSPLPPPSGDEKEEAGDDEEGQPLREGDRRTHPDQPDVYPSSSRHQFPRRSRSQQVRPAFPSSSETVPEDAEWASPFSGKVSPNSDEVTPAKEERTRDRSMPQTLSPWYKAQNRADEQDDDDDDDDDDEASEWTEGPQRKKKSPSLPKTDPRRGTAHMLDISFEDLDEEDDHSSGYSTDGGDTLDSGFMQPFGLQDIFNAIPEVAAEAMAAIKGALSIKEEGAHDEDDDDEEEEEEDEESRHRHRTKSQPSRRFDPNDDYDDDDDDNKGGKREKALDPVGHVVIEPVKDKTTHDHHDHGHLLKDDSSELAPTEHQVAESTEEDGDRELAQPYDQFDPSGIQYDNELDSSTNDHDHATSQLTIHLEDFVPLKNESAWKETESADPTTADAAPEPGPVELQQKRSFFGRFRSRSLTGREGPQKPDGSNVPFQFTLPDVVETSESTTAEGESESLQHEFVGSRHDAEEEDLTLRYLPPAVATHTDDHQFNVLHTSELTAGPDENFADFSLMSQEPEGESMTVNTTAYQEEGDDALPVGVSLPDPVVPEYFFNQKARSQPVEKKRPFFARVLPRGRFHRAKNTPLQLFDPSSDPVSEEELPQPLFYHSDADVGIELDDTSFRSQRTAESLMAMPTVFDPFGVGSAWHPAGLASDDYSKERGQLEMGAAPSSTEVSHEPSQLLGGSDVEKRKSPLNRFRFRSGARLLGPRRHKRGAQVEASTKKDYGNFTQDDIASLIRESQIVEHDVIYFGGDRVIVADDYNPDFDAPTTLAPRDDEPKQTIHSQSVDHDEVNVPKTARPVSPYRRSRAAMHSDVARLSDHNGSYLDRFRARSRDRRIKEMVSTEKAKKVQNDGANTEIVSLSREGNQSALAEFVKLGNDGAVGLATSPPSSLDLVKGIESNETNQPEKPLSDSRRRMARPHRQPENKKLASRLRDWSRRNDASDVGPSAEVIILKAVRSEVDSRVGENNANMSSKYEPQAHQEENEFTTKSSQPQAFRRQKDVKRAKTNSFIGRVHDKKGLVDERASARSRSRGDARRLSVSLDRSSQREHTSAQKPVAESNVVRVTGQLHAHYPSDNEACNAASRKHSLRNSSNPKLERPTYVAATVEASSHHTPYLGDRHPSQKQRRSKKKKLRNFKVELVDPSLIDSGMSDSFADDESEASDITANSLINETSLIQALVEFLFLPTPVAMEKESDEVPNPKGNNLIAQNSCGSVWFDECTALSPAGNREPQAGQTKPLNITLNADFFDDFLRETIARIERENDSNSLSSLQKRKELDTDQSSAKYFGAEAALDELANAVQRSGRIHGKQSRANVMMKHLRNKYPILYQRLVYKIGEKALRERELPDPNNTSAVSDGADSHLDLADMISELRSPFGSSQPANPKKVPQNELAFIGSESQSNAQQNTSSIVDNIEISLSEYQQIFGARTSIRHKGFFSGRNILSGWRQSNQLDTPSVQVASGSTDFTAKRLDGVNKGSSNATTFEEHIGSTKVIVSRTSASNRELGEPTVNNRLATGTVEEHAKNGGRPRKETPDCFNYREGVLCSLQRQEAKPQRRINPELTAPKKGHSNANERAESSTTIVSRANRKEATFLASGEERRDNQPLKTETLLFKPTHGEPLRKRVFGNFKFGRPGMSSMKEKAVVRVPITRTKQSGEPLEGCMDQVDDSSPVVRISVETLPARPYNEDEGGDNHEIPGNEMEQGGKSIHQSREAGIKLSSAEGLFLSKYAKNPEDAIPAGSTAAKISQSKRSNRTENIIGDTSLDFPLLFDSEGTLASWGKLLASFQSSPSQSNVTTSEKWLSEQTSVVRTDERSPTTVVNGSELSPRNLYPPSNLDFELFDHSLRSSDA